MKRMLGVMGIVAITLTLITGCSKEKIEQKTEDLVVQVITDGTWVVTKLTEGANDITSTFSGWECNFYTDRTCAAKKGTTTVKGTWDGSATTQSMTSNFPAGTDPLPKLNGTWKIVKTNYTFGQFTQTKNGIDYVLEITKK